MITYNELVDKVLKLESENTQLRQEINFLRSNDQGHQAPQQDMIASGVDSDSGEPYFRTMLDNIPAMVGYWDKNLINRFSNKAYSTWFGISSEDLLGKHLRNLLGEKLFALNLQFIHGVLQGIPQQFEREIPSPDGNSVRYSLAEYIPNIVNGQVEGFFVQVSDITPIKETEISLRKSEERYRLVVQDQTELISRLRSDGVYLFANEMFLNFFGKTEEELIGFKWIPLVYEDDLDFVTTELSKLNPNNPVVMIENRVYSGTGEVVWMQFSNRGTFDEAGNLTEIQSVGRDISQLKKANQALKLASVVYLNTLEAIIVTDAHKNILSVNPAFTKISGFTSEDVVGKTLSLFKSSFHDAEFYQELWKCISELGSWNGEIWFSKKHNEIYPCHVAITHVVNSVSEVSNYVMIFSDISESKKQEENRLNNEKLHRETLIREVHHRIKNNLHGVTGLLSNSITKYPELDEPIREAISKVKSIGIIHGLLGNNSTRNIRLIDLIKSIVESHESLFNTNISFTHSDQSMQFCVIENESVPIALILNELILNAIKHACEPNQVKVNVIVQEADSKIDVEIINPAQLPVDTSISNPKIGTGLQLIKSLMPKQNLALNWVHESDSVTTLISLSYPIVCAYSVTAELQS